MCDVFGEEVIIPWARLGVGLMRALMAVRERRLFWLETVRVGDIHQQNHDGISSSTIYTAAKQEHVVCG